MPLTLQNQSNFIKNLFALNLSGRKISALQNYYDLIQQHNEILHLVAPCEAEEFAIRHILEKSGLLGIFAANARFADLGTGAGLLSIPACSCT